MSEQTFLVEALDGDVVKVRQDGALLLLTVAPSGAAALDPRGVLNLIETLGVALEAMLTN